jgi:cytochrome c peroxidase
VVEAQAMLPVTSRVEMRGDASDPNPISQIPDGNLPKIWSKLMDRLLSIPGYRKLFKKAYPNKKFSELQFADAANAIGRWEREAYTFVDAPFDQDLKGNDDALTKTEKKGARIFYGKGDCASCHSGTLTTDQEFHNIAAPQIGPGKGSTKPLDPGRFIVTGQQQHKFEFRTPQLRNVELTPPYMHSGAYESLEKAIEHHLNPKRALENYDGSQLRADFRKELNNSPSVQKRLLKSLDWRLKVRAKIQRIRRHPLKLSDRDVDHLVAFLKAMTSPKAENNLENTIPSSVPSGLLEDGT